MAGVELTQEQQATLRSMGFEDGGSGDLRTEVNGKGLWLWSPKLHGAHETQWIADWQPGKPVDAPGNLLFDDPITAATWLLIQASNQ